MSSKALAWYWVRSFFDQKKTFPKIKKDALLSIPIPRLDFSDPNEKQEHDEVVAKVEQMLAAKAALAEAWTTKDKNFHAQKCDALDRQIDRLVHDLYGLTEDEIAIIEKAAE